MRQLIRWSSRSPVTARLRAAAVGAVAPILATVLILLVPATPPAAQAPCHGPGIGDDGRAMLPGTDALRIKYRGVTHARRWRKVCRTVATDATRR